MNKTKQLAFAILAVAGLAGCASTPAPELAGAETTGAQPPEQVLVSRPASYGSLGGYRYRRLVAIHLTSR